MQSLPMISPSYTSHYQNQSSLMIPPHMLPTLDRQRKTSNDDENSCARTYYYCLLAFLVIFAIFFTFTIGLYAPGAVYYAFVGPVALYIVGIICLDYGIKTKSFEALYSAYFIIILGFIAAMLFLSAVLIQLITQQESSYYPLITFVAFLMAFTTVNTVFLLSIASKFRTAEKLLRKVEALHAHSIMV
eukprot:TRINITY_DN27232_c0_g1_i1.p1 TRINITY_DN27232_c0_g1~~TRINITY_DN27232_c0_g1_i1.p1  ORF type:complete len:188 (+),score=31.04 TRINITY_DN27232_c0_g1_i1:171-734(+)